MEMEFNLEAFFVSVREENIAFVISIYSIFLNLCKFTNSCAILNYFFYRVSLSTNILIRLKN